MHLGWFSGNKWNDISQSTDLHDFTFGIAELEEKPVDQQGQAKLTVTPVNDAPVASDITLNAIDEDNSVVIKESELLSTASDVDGDTLSVKDLKVANGQGELADNGDGTFTFTPDKNWNCLLYTSPSPRD